MLFPKTRMRRYKLSVQLFGILSGLLVIVSAVPYIWGIIKGHNHPSIASWGPWSVIGLALLLTYDGSGARWNLAPAIFSFTNPTIITIVALKRHGWVKFGQLEWTCVSISLSAIVLWFFLRGREDMMLLALSLAIVADLVAAIPQIKLAWRSPDLDRPFAWGLFGIGYALAIFAIEEKTVANYILPLWMFFGSWSITLPLVLHRLRMETPIKYWI